MSRTIDGIPVHCSHTELKPIGELQPHPKNPNTHPEKQIDLLATIIRVQGWRNPVVVSKRSNLIIKGHGRLAAALKAGFQQVPVDYQEYENEHQEWEDMIADNRIAELSSFDTAQLGELIQQLGEAKVDLSLAGFTEEDLKGLASIKIPGAEGGVNIPQGSESNDFHQMTFTVSTAQQDRIYEAIALAKKLGNFEDEENKNGNGNALFEIADHFMRTYGDSQENNNQTN